MVGHIAPCPGRGLWIRPQVERVEGLPLLRAGCRGEPEDWRPGALARACRALGREGARRALAPPGFTRWREAARWGLEPVDTGPFCRALAAPIALAGLEGAGHPPEPAAVALRGARVSRALWEAAWALCGRVRLLYVTAPQGGGELRRALWEELGIPGLEEGRGTADLALHFDPDLRGGGRVVDLSRPGPELEGFTLRAPERALPADCDPLPLLALLWETGRLSSGEIQVLPAPTLDRKAQTTYNTT